MTNRYLFCMAPGFRLRTCLYMLLLANWILVGDVSAQVVEACEAEVSRAEEHYRDGEFAEAERLLLRCLDYSELSDEIAIRGYRILAQAQLQTGNIAGARRAVLRVFALNPAYRSDPIQDPPDYQALVETVRQQLDDPAFEAELEATLRQQLEPEPTPPQAVGYRSMGSIFVQGSAGVTSYGGERGAREGSAFSEFFNNGGPVFSVAGAYNLNNHFALLLAYDAGRYATIFDQKSGFPFIDENDSSPWLHTLSGSLMARLLPRAIATPYLRGGVGSSFIKINDSMQSAVALDVAIGVDVAVSQSIGVIAEAGGRYAMPGDAIDLIQRSRSYDFLTLFRIGVAHRIGSIR